METKEKRCRNGHVVTERTPDGNCPECKKVADRKWWHGREKRRKESGETRATPRAGECRKCGGPMKNGSCVACRLKKPCIRCGRADNRTPCGTCRCSLKRNEPAQKAYRKGRTPMHRKAQRHGVPVEELQALLASLDGKCASCGDPLTPGKGTNLDHHHKKNTIRSFLCMWCNLAIGYLKDSSERARKLAEYLEKFGD